jgi:hypothetical protein
MWKQRLSCLHEEACSNQRQPESAGSNPEMPAVNKTGGMRDMLY